MGPVGNPLRPETDLSHPQHVKQDPPIASNYRIFDKKIKNFYTDKCILLSIKNNLVHQKEILSKPKEKQLKSTKKN